MAKKKPAAKPASVSGGNSASHSPFGIDGVTPEQYSIINTYSTLLKLNLVEPLVGIFKSRRHALTTLDTAIAAVEDEREGLEGIAMEAGSTVPVVVQSLFAYGEIPEEAFFNILTAYSAVSAKTSAATAEDLPSRIRKLNKIVQSRGAALLGYTSIEIKALKRFAEATKYARSAFELFSSGNITAAQANEAHVALTAAYASLQESARTFGKAGEHIRKARAEGALVGHTLATFTERCAIMAETIGSCMSAVKAYTQKAEEIMRQQQ